MNSVVEPIPWLHDALWLGLGFLGIFPGIVAYMVLAERKLAGRFQDRIGPNRVGPMGLLQPIADVVKLVTKETIVPRSADAWVHLLAPIILLISSFLMLAVIPFGPGLVAVDLPAGVLYLLAVSGLSPLGIFLAGWSSRNKFSLLGGMRAVAQLVSYEIPQVLAIVPVLLWSGSLSLVTIVGLQAEDGHWFAFSPPGFVAFLTLVITGVAEVNRAPFDLAEAESEIVAGFHVEYSGMRFALFFLAEYLGIFAVSCLATALFLGGGSLPFVGFPANLLRESAASAVLANGVSAAIFSVKVALFIFGFFWIRVTLPRMRVDRLMNFAWKVLVPIGLVNVAAAAVWFECVYRPGGPGLIAGWLLTGLLLAGSIAGVAAINRGSKPAIAIIDPEPAPLSAGGL